MLADIVIRTATVAQIETLCTIDLAACALYEAVGMRVDIPSDHEFSVAERRRWLECLAAGTTLLALRRSGEPVGFAAAGVLDEEPYLDQLSVRPSAMQRGIGTALLNAVIDLTKARGGRALWLTTYGHLAWNRPFYERNGFRVVPAQECGAEISRELAYQCRWLPGPEHRLVMRRTL